MKMRYAFVRKKDEEDAGLSAEEDVACLLVTGDEEDVGLPEHIVEGLRQYLQNRTWKKMKKMPAYRQHQEAYKRRRWLLLTKEMKKFRRDEEDANLLATARERNPKSSVRQREIKKNGFKWMAGRTLSQWGCFNRMSSYFAGDLDWVVLDD